ncbi:MAG: anthranilate phosphoribosyltransferase [Bacteroidia bacterium]
MKKILNKLYEHQALSKTEAREMLTNIALSKYNNSEVASFLSVYLMRSITVDELEGFQEAMLELCLKINFSDAETIDLVGTGGDGKNTFNISTLACFVVAGAGIKVTKHGNYGVSSVSGSSNVMEFLGYTFSNNSDVLKRELDRSGICFLHAPLFHPAMKNVAPIRKELGVKTFFNILGPIVNPAFPAHQLLGVYNLELARLYNYLFQKTAKKYTIVHSLDGYDEISLTAPFKVISTNSEQLLSPEDIGFRKLKQDELFGGNSVKEAAEIFITVLNDKATEAQKNAIIANAGMAIHCVKSNLKLSECLAMAKESIESKKALSVFNKLITK